VSFEYVLFEGINDSPTQARSLAQLLQGMKCHVNLIPANATGNRDFRPPSRRTVLSFETELKRGGANTTIRQPKGQGITAGCGQLRSRQLTG
jgi:23S rRNA (adenine2503-C2)-methyltransferase